MTVIGVLTAGGDCPGTNAAIRAITTCSLAGGESEVVGVLRGWEGLMEGDILPLDRDSVRGILGLGGTILGTSRKDPYVHGDGYESIRRTVEGNGIDVVVVIGGDGTLKTAQRLSEEGLRVIGIPKTIDNDVASTDFAFGFDTAVQIVSDAVDRLTTTAEAHNRVILVEVMGRTRGWIATCGGMAAGADAILIPEMPLTMEEVTDIIRRRHRRGRNYSVIVVAEGIEPPVKTEPKKDLFGFDRLGGVAYDIAPLIEELTGFETRVTVLGHLQRGGTPTAFDRVLATRFGVAAAELALSGAHGVMVALHGTRIEPVPLREVGGGNKGIDPALYEVAKAFFG
jgi:phosphofructokinase-like protein